MGQFKDIPVGTRFGMLVVQGVADPIQGKGKRYSASVVRCDCGKVFKKKNATLRVGDAVSCGCRKVKHGESRNGTVSPEYESWRSMIERCQSANNANYKNYGGRGISVCQRWANSFEPFLEDMGRRPTPDHSIDRIDNDGNYEPGNCRWATKRQQANNTRWNRRIEIDGVEKTLSQWSRESGVPAGTISTRLNRGVDPKEAIKLRGQA